uniref:Uncharacterized protein n=1 Tax=Anopheles minimus TaxID=112268 RepID=A0A182VTN2_9DIPT
MTMFPAQSGSVNDEPCPSRERCYRQLKILDGNCKTSGQMQKKRIRVYRTLNPGMKRKRQHHYTTDRWQSSLTTPASSCYELINGQEYLQPSTAIDPSQDHFTFAVLAQNRSHSIWKLMTADPSCFYLCNVRTGQYLMVAANDRAYTVNRTLLSSYNKQSFIFGLYYPNWPASFDAHVTNSLKQQLLCTSAEIEPITQNKLIDTFPNENGLRSTDGVACYWQLAPQTTCPSDSHC